MLFRTVWIVAWFFLILGSTFALVNVSLTTCDDHIPILLSRALSTDPYRGATLVFCLIAAICSFELNSFLLTIGFFGFFSAFLVSMFETASSHDALILMSSALVMYECYPQKSRDYYSLWQWHWWFTISASLVTTCWFFYMVYGCKPISDFDINAPLPESVRCARCSWWFISEYICFWSMFILVYWKINPTLQLRNEIIQKKEEKEEKGSLIAKSNEEKRSLIAKSINFAI